MTDTASAITHIADFLGDANRDRHLDILGTSAEAAECFLLAVREMTRSTTVFAKPCPELSAASFVVGEYEELYVRSHLDGCRKLIVMEGFDMAAAFATLLHLGLATRALTELGGDNGRLVISYQKAGDFPRDLSNRWEQ